MSSHPDTLEVQTKAELVLDEEEDIDLLAVVESEAELVIDAVLEGVPINFPPVTCAFGRSW